MGRYRLIVFDWDGTVADSLQHIVTSMHAAFASAQLPPRPTGQVLAIIGLGMDEAISRLYPDIDGTARADLIRYYGQHYRDATTGATTLYNDAEDTLRQLAEEGYLLAIATGKSRRGLERAVAETGVKHYFHASRCADETFSKPHPQMLLDIMDSLGTEPEQTLMVGDSEHDLQMAANAGVAAVAVSYGAQPLQRLLEFNPLTSLQCLGDLPRWLKTQQT
jgi:phosphoglycolate phosphatase